MRTKNGSALKKSLLGILSAAAIMAGSAMPVFAEDKEIASFTKEYQAAIPDGADVSKYPSPAEEFRFQDSKGNRNQADLYAVKYTSFNTEEATLQYLSDSANLTSVPNSDNTVMNLSLGTASFDAGQAGTTGVMTRTVSIAIPDGSKYTVPGNYYYYFQETVGNTAGVYYNTVNENNPITYLIVVPVIMNNGTPSVDQNNIHILDQIDNNKVNQITNSYNAGTFDFQKKVTGTAGDITKTFKVDVTLKKPSGRTMSSVIKVENAGAGDVPVPSELTAILPDDWTGDTYTKTFTVKDGTDIRFTNVPAGTQYLVAEESAPGYTTTYTIGNATSPVADNNLAQTMISQGSTTIVITNNRNQTIDTGVFTSNLPYFIILFAAAGGLVILLVSKKHRA